MVWFFKSLKASGKCASSSSMRRLALTEESVAVPAPITAPLAAVSQAASLATTSCSSNDSCDVISPFAEQQQLQQARDRLRRRSLPAMHLLEERSSLRWVITTQSLGGSNSCDVGMQLLHLCSTDWSVSRQVIHACNGVFNC